LASGAASLDLDIDDCIPLLEICDHLQAPTLDARVWKVLRRQVCIPSKYNIIQPWAIFKLAAKRGDDIVCGKAVLAFEFVYTFDEICSQQFGFYEDLPVRYVATLLTGNYRWKIRHGGQSTYTQVTWEEVASRFFNLKKGGLSLAAGTGS
jgi:hypothetical protein